MEIPSWQTKHIDKLVDLIERFSYSDQTITSGAKKLDIEKLRILLTAFIAGNKIHQNDKLYLIKKFSFGLRKYLENYTNSIIQTPTMDDKFLAFIMDIFDMIQIRLKAEYEKEIIIATIRDELLQNINQPISLTRIKNIVEKKFLGKFIYGFSEQEPIYAVIKSNDDHQYRVDIKNAAILYDCGKTLEKFYKFNENKLFVFEQPSFQSKEKIQAFVEEFVAIADEGTLGDFFVFLKDKLKITYSDDLMKRINKLNQKADMVYIYEKQRETFAAMIQRMLNTEQIGLTERKIFQLNTQGNVEYLGTWKTVEEPRLIKDGGYKGLPGVEIVVTDIHDKQHVIVTNGKEKDKFEI